MRAQRYAALLAVVAAATVMSALGMIATAVAADGSFGGSAGPVIESVTPSVIPPTALAKRHRLVIRGRGFDRRNVLVFVDGGGRRHVRRPGFVNDAGTLMHYDIAVGTRPARWEVRVVSADGAQDTAYFRVSCGRVAPRMVLVFETRIAGSASADPEKKATFDGRARAARVEAIRRRLEESGADPQPVVYAVSLNEKPVSSGTLVLRQGRRYFLPVGLVQDMDIALAPGFESLEFEGERFADISALDGVEARPDPASQSLSLTADAAALNVQRLDARHSGGGRPQPSDPALFLNYNATAYDTGRTRQIDSLFEIGAAKGALVGRTSGVLSDIGGSAEWIRLETSLVNDRPDTRTRLTLGDSLARPTDVSDPGAPYAFAGVQWGTRFENDPDYRPYPLPTLYGEAAGSSVLDLYVDQSLRLRSEVEAGPFVIDAPPLSAGSGEVRVVVRDVTGRERVISAPYYVSTRLLQPGVGDYEINAGVVRESFGSGNSTYGEGFAAGRYRLGLSEWFTGQVVAETSQRHQMIGSAGVVLIPRLGVASVSIAASREDDKTGSSAGFTLEHSAARWRASVGARRFDERFTQLGRIRDGRETARLYTAELGWSTRRGDALSLRFADRERANGSRAKLLGASYSRRLPRGIHLGVSVSIGERSELATRDGEAGYEEVEDRRVGVSLRKYLGSRQSAGVSHERDIETRDGERAEESLTTVNYQRYAPRDIGVGYELRYDRASGSRYAGGVDWKTRNGNVSGRVSGGEHGTSYYANVDGSLVAAAGRVFLERPLGEGFAVVSTGDFPGVEIYRNNQLAARSDSRGMAVVPALLPYQVNELSIRENDLPLSARIGSRSVRVVPYFKGAAPAVFDIRRQRSALLVLVDTDGVALPVGTRLSAGNTGASFPVAMRGEAYVTEFPPDGQFTAMLPDGRRCLVFVTPLPAQDDAIPRIGPLTCQPRVKT